jgi:sodium/bile acid cotransporter 7
MAWMLGRSGVQVPLAPVINDLLQWLVLPLAAGQVARRWLGAWAARHRSRLQLVDRLTILMLIYTSFADSVQQGIWSHYGLLPVAQSLAGSALLFVVALACVWAGARLMRLTPEDRIAAVFCGSKKSLATGVPMAALIFGAHPALGLVLMPLMVYHPLQLAVGGMLAQRWGRRAPATAAP